MVNMTNANRMYLTISAIYLTFKYIANTSK